MLRTTLRAAVAAVAAVAALTACGPMTMGAAVIIGAERISTTRVEREIRAFREAYERNPVPRSQLSFPVPRSLTRSTLTQLIWFRLAEQAAERSGIDISSGRIETYIAENGGRERFEQRAMQVGLAPRHAADVARYLLVSDRLAAVHVPNASPSKSARTVNEQLTSVARELGVRVSPRYGRFDYRTLVVRPDQEDSLSRPAGVPASPAR